MTKPKSQQQQPKAPAWEIVAADLAATGLRLFARPRTPRGSRHALALVLDLARAQVRRALGDTEEYRDYALAKRRGKDLRDHKDAGEALVKMAGDELVKNVRELLTGRRAAALRALAAAAAPHLTQLLDVARGLAWLEGSDAGERLAAELLNE